MAQQADRLGFESIWLFDHLHTTPRPTDEITFESFTTMSALAALTIPVLCITGEEDVVIPTPAIETLVTLLPKGRLARVPRSGHSVYFERADTFNRLVGEYLKEVDA